jgi:hypothetical protein
MAQDAPPQPLSPRVQAAPGKGVTITSADDRFSLNLRSRFVVQDTVSLGKSLANDVSIKTTRLFLGGHLLSPQTRYLMQFAFGPAEFDASSPTPLFDAWLEHRFHRDLSLRVGQYFVPFDRARTVREFALQTVDRAPMVMELTLDRDAGLTLQSQDFLGLDGMLSYQLSVFGGEGRNRSGGSPMGLLYVGRMSVHPFGAFDDDSEGDLLQEAKPRLMVGLAGAYNQNATRNRGTTGTPLTLGGFDYTHLASDVVFKYAGLSLLGEVVYRRGLKDYNEGTLANGFTGREWSRSGVGYKLQAGMMLTDQLELSARWSQLFAISPTDPALEALVQERGKEITAGLSYYLNGHQCKVQSGYTYQFGDLPDQGRHALRTHLDVMF